MPAQMIHLAIARNILKSIKCNNHGLFYLGSLSPDAIHMRKDTGRAEKNITHFHSSDHTKWQNDALNLLIENKQSKQVSFYFGYVSHILADICWLHEIYYKTTEIIKSDQAPILNASDAYYNDLVQIDYEVNLQSPWKYDVFKQIKEAVAPNDFDLLSETEIESWKLNTIDHYKEDRLNSLTPIRYMNPNDIEKYIQTATKLIVNIFS